ncbi:MAG: type II secretion system GspH family protein [Candidatus Moranbacteria bacterium]|nr:type II secretion system GspH family protein [Candidatus Moranbacteria bacterium]
MTFKQKSKKISQKRKGFTLIELLIVVAIIGILSSVIIIALTDSRQRAKTSKTLASLRDVHTALESYRAQFNGYPVSSGWQGYCSFWGADLGDNWIPELQSSNVISTPVLPTDARQPGNGAACANDQEQIIYCSNGADYKLISVTNSSMATVPSNLIDPIRPASAYGFWSSTSGNDPSGC